MTKSIRCTYCGKDMDTTQAGRNNSVPVCNECKEESDRHFSPYPQMY